jgi:hypothetical protein
MMLTRHGTEFDPQIRFVGEELLPRADLAEATLIVFPHTMLSVLITRQLRDTGVRYVAVSADPIKVPGTRVDANVLVPTRTLLVTIRKAFEDGSTVCAMIDRGSVERRNTSVPTARGELLVSTPLMEIALRRRVRILFTSTMLDANGIVTMTTVEPPQNEATTVTELVSEFAKFVETYVHGDR